MALSTTRLGKVWPTVAALALLIAGGGLGAQDIDAARLVEEFEPKVRKAMSEGAIPSCSVALVAGDRIVWSRAFGHSNLWANTEATPDTVYLIGSTFKTMSSSALLALMEEGKFGIDDPVRDYLGDLGIEGEDPEHPITFRHLFSHVSGLPAAFGPHLVWGETVPAPLPEYLAKSLKVSRSPELKVEYSNLAYTLIAHLVERLSGMPFKDYVRERIFKPLKMESTAFMPTPSMEERLAVPYVHQAGSGKQIPTIRYKADVWPAGMVYGVVEDQARWLLALLNQGRAPQGRILQEETVRLATSVQYEQFQGPMTAGWGNDSAGYGLSWWVCRKDGERHFAHSGSVPGYTAFLEGNLDRRMGFAILTNGNRAHAHLVALADEAIRLMKRFDRAPAAGR